MDWVYRYFVIVLHHREQRIETRVRIGEISCNCLQTKIEKCVYVIDGGMLLHRVPWKNNDKYESIFNSCVGYLKRNFKSDVVVVFNGYMNNSTSTKPLNVFDVVIKTYLQIYSLIWWRDMCNSYKKVFFPTEIIKQDLLNI